MSAFEPLIRIGRTAFPYWLVAAVIISVLAAFVSKKKSQAPFISTATAHAVSICGLCFIILGTYVQLAGDPMSFAELLPSSMVVIAVAVATMTVLAQPKRKGELRAAVVGLMLGTVLLGPLLAVIVSFFPKLILLQWHLLSRV